MEGFLQLSVALPLRRPSITGRAPYYPIPVSFFNRVSVLSAVTIGDRSYSPVNSTWTSKSTARQIEYKSHANAK